jgi:hypothetical protein
MLLLLDHPLHDADMRLLTSDASSRRATQQTKVHTDAAVTAAAPRQRVRASSATHGSRRWLHAGQDAFDDTGGVLRGVCRKHLV